MRSTKGHKRFTKIWSIRNCKDWSAKNIYKYKGITNTYILWDYTKISCKYQIQKFFPETCILLIAMSPKWSISSEQIQYFFVISDSMRIVSPWQSTNSLKRYFYDNNTTSESLYVRNCLINYLRITHFQIRIELDIFYVHGSINHTQ